MICVWLVPGRESGRRDRPIRTGRRDKPVIQLPSIALRVAILLGLAVLLFGIILFRLWYLQILSGEDFAAQANDNRLRSVKVVAPRGTIQDRNGKAIVENRAGLAVGIRLMDVPPGELAATTKRLARVLNVKERRIRKKLAAHAGVAFAQLDEQGGPGGIDLVVVKEDVDRKVVSYLLEHKQSFPGVEIRKTYLRDYPQGALAAHLLGSIGEISPEQLKEPRYKGYGAGDVIGQGGLESTYDQWLRGRDGVAKVEVDAHGRPKSGSVAPGGRLPQPGASLKTTIDSRVQAETEDALRYAISLAHSHRELRGQRRGRPRARRAQWGGAGDGQLSDVRPGRLGGRHQHQGLREALRSVRQPALAQPRHPIGEGRGLHVQGRRRRRRP